MNSEQRYFPEKKRTGSERKMMVTDGSGITKRHPDTVAGCPTEYLFILAGTRSPSQNVKKKIL
jgi:hypothetical protein